jgi:uncharacterized protein (DUF2141 family)
MVTLPLIALLAAAPVASSPDLGKAEGRCRDHETGPALLIEVAGLKDRSGLIKAEVYPSNDADFLQDDNILINTGKVFRRVEYAVPANGTPTVCIRVPGPGAYSVILMHDRNANRKFNWREDGIGFPGNPHLGWSKPKATSARLVAGGDITRVRIVLNYAKGLGMAPLRGN